LLYTRNYDNNCLSVLNEIGLFDEELNRTASVQVTSICVHQSHPSLQIPAFCLVQ